MSSGTFQVGETVMVMFKEQDWVVITLVIVRPSITFRVAQSNHKEGQYNAPSVTYASSPYIQKPIPASHIHLLQLLNVDTYSHFRMKFKVLLWLGRIWNGSYWKD